MIIFGQPSININIKGTLEIYKSQFQGNPRNCKTKIKIIEND